MTVAVQRSSDPIGDDEAGEGLRPRKGENLRGENRSDKPYLSVLIPIGSMVLLYMVCHGSRQHTLFMLAYIPAPWILWDTLLHFNI